MSDQLSTLLQEEAAAQGVPAAPVTEIVSAGRRLRRRRRVRTAAVGALALAALTAAGLVASAGGDQRDVRPADQIAYQQQGAWIADGTVHIGNHTVPLRAGTHAVADVGYTSEGALVFDAGSRAGGHVRPTLTLVRPDGEIRAVDAPGVATLRRLPGTDPSLPYAALMRGLGRPGRHDVQLVLLDLRDNTERVLGTQTVRRRHGDDAAAYYQIVLSPDLVSYPRLQGADGTYWDAEMRWRTGERLQSPDYGLNFRFWNVGRSAVVIWNDANRSVEVFDRADGRRLLTVPDEPDAGYLPYPSLSVDGRWLGQPTAHGFVLHEVATGATRTFGADWEFAQYGWTPDGHVIGLHPDPSNGASTVEICDPADGRCTSTGTTLPDTGSTFVVPRRAYAEIGFP